MESPRLTQVIKLRAVTGFHFQVPLHLVNMLMKRGFFENKKWKAALLVDCSPSFRRPV
jgi:hypothetical protein